MSEVDLQVQDHRAAEVTARVSRLELRVDDLDQLFPLPDRGARATSADHGDEALAEWVATFFAITFARPLGGEHRWCRQWRAHPEAVFRLRALRKAFVVLQEDTEMGHALWLRDHLDPQLSTLLGPRGPFVLCSQDRHDVLPSLRTDGSISRQMRDGGSGPAAPGDPGTS